MAVTIIIAIIGAIVGAIVGSLLTWLLQRHWTHDQAAAEVVELRKELAAIRQEFAGLRHSVEMQDKEELEWAARFERLANRISRISPGLTVQVPGTASQKCLYSTVFPEPKFREALETYVVPIDSSKTLLSPRSPRPDELRRGNLRTTVERAERCMVEFQEKYPQVNLSYYMADIGS